MSAEVDQIVQRLVEERTRRGLSQRAVVRALGCSTATVNSWERGLQSPTLNHLRAWAAVLGHELTLSPDPTHAPRTTGETDE